jgi:ABC-type dipeptide/oligopeptide/nickel transport system ATPase component
VVALVGESGVGKTTVAKAAASYLHARNRFPGGVIFVSLSHVRTVERIKREIHEALREASVTPHAVGGAPHVPKSNCLFILDGLVSHNLIFFDVYLFVLFVFCDLQSLFLFIYCSCEILLLRQQNRFREFLRTWFDRVGRAQAVSICITCAQPLQSLAAQLYTVTHMVEKLHPLRGVHPARLLKLHCPRLLKWEG